MKRMIVVLALVFALALGASALADYRLSEAQMLYEDYDGNQATQLVSDAETLLELEQILARASKNPAELENCTMNCTLLCTLEGGEIYDIAVATDGCPYITDMTTDKTYRLEDEDQVRLWEIFDLIQATMGYDAALVMGW